MAHDSLRLSLPVALFLALVTLAGCGKGVSTDPSDPLPGSDGSPCGNGRIDEDADEECDGDFLGEETCESLGYGDGVLHCDPVACTFDTSMCEGLPMDTGGTGGGSVGGSGG